MLESIANSQAYGEVLLNTFHRVKLWGFIRTLKLSYFTLLCQMNVPDAGS